MEVESSLVAAQNALTIAPSQREPQKQAEAREQQSQRQTTELPKAQVVVRQYSAQAFEQAEQFRQRNVVDDDTQSQKSKVAISAYQSLSDEQQKSEIQQMLGIDTYA